MKKKNLFIIALFIVTLITIPTTSFAAGTPNAPSDVIRKWTFNYVALDSIINKLEQEPGYTAGELTMFRDNCKKYLLTSRTSKTSGTSTCLCLRTTIQYISEGCLRDLQ